MENYVVGCQGFPSGTPVPFVMINVYLHVCKYTYTHTHTRTYALIVTQHTHSCTHTYRHNLIPYTSAYSIIYFTLAHMPSTPHYHNDNGTPNETSSVSASDVSSGSGKW